MDLKKECMVCGLKIGSNRCAECSKIVCNDHYVQEMNMCTICSASLR